MRRIRSKRYICGIALICIAVLFSLLSVMFTRNIAFGETSDENIRESESETVCEGEQDTLGRRFTKKGVYKEEIPEDGEEIYITITGQVLTAFEMDRGLVPVETYRENGMMYMQDGAQPYTVHSAGDQYMFEEGGEYLGSSGGVLRLLDKPDDTCLWDIVSTKRGYVIRNHKDDAKCVRLGSQSGGCCVELDSISKPCICHCTFYSPVKEEAETDDEASGSGDETSDKDYDASKEGDDAALSALTDQLTAQRDGAGTVSSEQTADDSNVTEEAAELTTGPAEESATELTAESTAQSETESAAGLTAETTAISEDVPRNAVWDTDSNIERPYVLRLFETTDVHGNLADISAKSLDKTLYRMAWISQKVNDARTRYGDDNVILLDTGDVYEGNILSNAVEGQCMIAAADIMRYDAYGIGNHEFNWGLNVMINPDATLRAYDFEGYKGDSLIPVVCCNLRQNGEKTEYAKDYVILEKKAIDDEGRSIDVKVGVLGFAADYSTGANKDVFSDLGYSTTADYNALDEQAKALKEQGCDIVILLAHKDANQMVHNLRRSSSIDLVLGGHSHLTECAVAGNGILYMEAGYNAKRYGQLEIHLSGDSSTRPVIDNASVVKVPIDSDELLDKTENKDILDQEIVALSRKAASYIYDNLEEPLAMIDCSLTKKFIDGNPGTSTMSNFLTEMIRDALEVDAAFVRGACMKEELKLEKGEITRMITLADIFSVDPINQTMSVYQVTWGEFLRLLEDLLSPDKNELLYMSGIDVEYTGQTVRKLTLPDGKVIYNEGEWTDNYESRIMRVGASIRTVEGASDIFDEWLQRGLEEPFNVDEKALIIEALMRTYNGGFYRVDQKPHWINVS